MKKLFPIILTLLLACNFNLTPHYNQAIVDKVAATADMNAKLYDYIASQPNRSYQLYNSNYDGVLTMITQLRQTDSIRIRPGKLLFIDRAIYDRFVKYQNAHADQDTISVEVLGVYKGSMETLWGDRFVAEINLKKQ